MSRVLRKEEMGPFGTMIKRVPGESQHLRRALGAQMLGVVLPNKGKRS